MKKVSEFPRLESSQGNISWTKELINELIKAMITQLQEDVLERELLLKEVTKSNKRIHLKAFTWWPTTATNTLVSFT